MAFTQAYTGSSTIGATEFSCPNNATYSSASAITVAGVYQVFLDTSAMVIGDQLRIEIYEKVLSSSTQRTIYQATLTGTMAQTWVSPSLILVNGWDVTLLAVVGSINVDWSIRKVA